jgi:type IV pilus assembly protein PilA
MSLAVLGGLKKTRQASDSTTASKTAIITIFWGLQSFTATFFVIHLLLPRYGGFLLDYLVIPTGLYFACAILPTSIVALSGFKKVQETSKAVAIRNNLRRLSAAADQFYLENGKAEASYSDIVGDGKYIDKITPIDGEQYELIKFKQGEIIFVKRSSGEIIAIHT